MKTGDQPPVRQEVQPADLRIEPLGCGYVLQRVVVAYAPRTYGNSGNQPGEQHCVSCKFHRDLIGKLVGDSKLTRLLIPQLQYALLQLSSTVSSHHAVGRIDSKSDKSRIIRNAE